MVCNESCVMTVSCQVRCTDLQACVGQDVPQVSLSIVQVSSMHQSTPCITHSQRTIMIHDPQSACYCLLQPTHHHGSCPECLLVPATANTPPWFMPRVPASACYSQHTIMTP